MGLKKFHLDRDDQTLYLNILSTKLDQELIENNGFDEHEKFHMLSTLEDRVLQLKILDLKYLLMIEFEKIRGHDFFIGQEILCGQSICDLSLSDPLSIQNAFKYIQAGGYHDDQTIIKRILMRDKVRLETFKKAGFVKDNLITSIDFNMKSTIERGIEQGSIKSVKQILNHIFKKININLYTPILMMDLPKILSQKKLTINEFFDRSYAEMQDSEETQFCNME